MFIIKANYIIYLLLVKLVLILLAFLFSLILTTIKLMNSKDKGQEKINIIAIKRLKKIRELLYLKIYV